MKKQDNYIKTESTINKPYVKTAYDHVTQFIAKTMAIVAPSYANRYYNQHLALRKYTAADRGNSYRNYKPQQTSGAQEISQGWRQTTNATRELARNNPHVAGMKQRFITSLIGEGSFPRPKILKDGADNPYDFDIERNQDILNRWEKWAPTAGANGDSIYQLQRLGAGHFFIDGGLLFRRVYIPIEGTKTKQLAIEPIELDHLDIAKDTDTEELRIVGGKELNIYNKVIAYWLKPRHPSEKDTESVRIPASDIIDLFDRQRASDVGGISRLASSVMNFYNIGMYRADTMKLARTALGYGVFIETDDPGGFFDEDAEADQGGNQYQYITPGGVHYLRKGEKINTVKPENPGTQYEPFLRSELRAASVGAGVSYESVSNDGSQSNFSSTRQMLLFEKAMIRYIFGIFEEQFYSKLYRWFIEFEMDFGQPSRLVLPNYEANPFKYLKVSFSRAKVDWVDPLKDARAGAQEVDMGTSTLTDICEASGKDIEEIVATRKYEIGLMKEAGIFEYMNTGTNEVELDKEESDNDDSETPSPSGYPTGNNS